MRARILVGITLALISLVSGCTKIGQPKDPVPEGYHYETFGMPATKAAVRVNWTDGDRVCVYSLDSDGVIVYKDTAEVLSIKGSSGKVKALVADDAVRYFSTYPEGAVMCEVGDVLDDDAYRPVFGGKFTDVSYMTCYIDPGETDMWFNNVFSLLKLDTSVLYGVVSVVSSFPSTSSVSKGSGLYYIPISYLDEQALITIVTSSGKRSVMRQKTLDARVGMIYEPSRW